MTEGQWVKANEGESTALSAFPHHGHHSGYKFKLYNFQPGNLCES